ncbi:polyhydroxyalkanoate depolymerase [Ralstonia sp. SET104]|uniref:polyhydroxyalkanoate depolymerase n=1 Tax=Ralstonia sp. SET104 TaxID=2448774 RepID=UPI000F58D3B5|nr:polyhydroxyalkanoate depolymerase [Ralstonia sp. SET104]GCB05272.1 esterase [Ralstonia sp. SET104]
MWYALVEQQRHWLRLCSESARQALSMWPATTQPHVAASYYDDLFASLLHPAVAPPPFALGQLVLDGRQHAIAETVVVDAPFCALRRFSCVGRTPAPRAILLCVPLSGHAAVMMRETVALLLEDGDVYVTDWLNARDVPLDAGRFSLNDYVRMLDGFLGTLSADRRPLHVVAVCQATYPALGALALRASSGFRPPVSVAMIGGPLDARRNPSMLGRAAESRSLEWCRRNLFDIVPAGFAGHGRDVFPAYLQLAEIVAVYPFRYLSLIDSYADATSHDDPDALADAQCALRDYMALLDMPAEYFLDIVDQVFQRACLANCTWRVDGEAVRPDALRDTVLITIEGRLDPITGAGQTHAAHGLCAGIDDARRYHLDVEACDHYGLFTGPHWRTVVHPALQAAFSAGERGAHLS